MRADLPSGTVTLLFTDIEGSTRLLHDLGAEGYGRALAEHRALLRAAFAAHGGVEVDTQGDAFFVAFPTAPEAVDAARAGQQALADSAICVRMGLHTGAPSLGDEGYVGADVHRGARIAALAHGGQVLVSSATAALLDGMELVDLGAHRLKDFDGATRLFQLGRATHSPLRTPGSVLLPTPATRFLGRERELFDAVSVVLDRDPRVLTILGPGGTGKTRFVIELARLLAEDADGGTLFVPLAALRDPDLVLPSLAEALGSDGKDPESIAARVGAKRTHVVLDNLEQLLPDAARAIASVLDAAPQLRLIVTSREALRIGAEVQLDLPPLAAGEAVELFLARARQVLPDISYDEEIDRICERLDRLPLAIELAAARTRLLSPQALLERLGARLDLLRGGRDADPRHATLTATIAWSYDLLDEDEQRLFASLAVFQGGGTLEAVEVVCDADVDSLASLLDKSLLRRRADPDGTDRFWMLETIREYATARLDTSGDEDALRTRQARWLLGLAERAGIGDDDHTGVPGRWHLDLVAPELDNLRAVLTWAAERAPELGLEVAGAFEAFWAVREPVEGAVWLERLLRAAPDASDRVRARSLRALGGALEIYGESERAAPFTRASLALFESLGDERKTALQRFRVAANLVNRGLADGARLIDESLEEFRRLDLPVGELQALGYLGATKADQGDLQAAAALMARSAALAGELDWLWWQQSQLMNLAEVERQLELHAEAEGHAREALLIARDMGDRLGLVFAAAELASTAAARGDALLAGRLWGAIESEEARGPVGQWPSHRDMYEALVRAADGPEFERARQEGALLHLADAADLA